MYITKYEIAAYPLGAYRRKNNDWLALTGSYNYVSCCDRK